MVRFSRFLFFAILLAGCAGSEDASPEPSATPTTPTVTTTVAPTSTSSEPELSMSIEASSYLDDALEVMKQVSINRDSVDWAMIEESAIRAAAQAVNPAGTYAAIRLALTLLNDQHSIFLTPTEAKSFSEGDAVFITPVVELRTTGLGYISIGRYLGDIGAQADEYAENLAAEIDAVAGEVCGWVLDLQSNTGGNMWPMLAGLAPLLTPGTIGSFTYPDGAAEPWENTGTSAIWDGMPMTSNGRPNPVYQGLPVAVLIGSLTGSSGEAVAVAFKGQDDVRFFGQQTAGLTTSNEPVELSDGALLVLTMSSFTDRHGNQYGLDTPVQPDHQTTSYADSESSALEWLQSQSSCG